MSGVVKAPPRVIVGVDQAMKKAGWAVRLQVFGASIAACGPMRTFRDRDTCMATALSLAGGDIEQVFVQFEDHAGISLTYKTRSDPRRLKRKTTGYLFDAPLLHGQAAPTGGAPQRGTAQILGMGEALGLWTDTLERLGHPESLRGFVGPFEWRKRVLGSSAGDTDANKRRALLYVASRVTSQVIRNHNVAEAVAIADYGALYGVGALLGERQERRAMTRVKTAKKKQARIRGWTEPPPAGGKTT